MASAKKVAAAPPPPKTKDQEKIAMEAGVKFIELTTGTVRWQKQPDRITAPRDAAKLAEAVEALREHGLERFVRVAEEVNKAYAHLLKFKPDDQELALRLEIARLELAALVDPGGAATAERLERARAMLAELNPPKPKPKPKTGD